MPNLSSATGIFPLSDAAAIEIPAVKLNKDGSFFVSMSSTPDKALPYFTENPPLEKYRLLNVSVFRFENMPPYEDSKVNG
jgi:hypothetical protein